ncbi:hypothetical protein GIB67_042968 [Kingdonia uniflora]|uniref:peptidylprolyl isomerase n=1 Tax=Kingdonia uniflora TaxID=39325 RepID=A0A7J7L651_9MAGN|nr:hypothetical protein GIB67_042968 [Kingdonia uniflora]
MVDEVDIDKRRNVLGLVYGISSFVATSFNAKGGGLPPEEKPRLCDAACEKDLENFVGERSALSFSCWRWLGLVIKGLNEEGILTMKVRGKRRLYIPGYLAFPKGLNSTPRRPRVAPSSSVVFYVSLEFVPGLDSKEEEE